MDLKAFRGFTPIQSPCFFVNPIDKNFIYPYAKYIVIEQPDGKQTFLHGHRTNINCMNLSPRGRIIASGETGREADVYVWNYAKRSLLFRLSEHDGTTTCLAFSQDERLLVTCGEDRRLILWDMATGNIVTHRKLSLYTFAKWGGKVPDIKGRPTLTFYLATSGPDGVDLHVIDPSNGTVETQRLPMGKFTRTVTSMEFTDTHLICGTTSSDILVFELHSRTLVQQPLHAGRGGVTSMFQGNDGAILAGAADGSIFNVCETEATELTNVGHPIASLGDGLLLSKDGCLLDSSGSVRWQCHPTEATSVAVCGNVAATSAADRVIKVWDLSGLRTTVSFTPSPRQPPTTVALSPTLLTAGFGQGAIGGFDFETGEELFMITHAHHGDVTALEIAPTRRFFASGSADTTVRLWDVRTRQMFMNLKHHGQKVTALSFLPSASYLYSASDDMSVCLIDIDKETMIERVTSFDSGVRDIDVADDRLITCTQDGHISLFRIAETLQPTQSKKVPEANAVAFSPDGRRFAVGHLNGSVSLWDAGSMSRITELPVHSGSVADLRYATAGVISAGMDGGVALLSA